MMPILEDDNAQSEAEERNRKFRFGIRKWSPDCLQIFRHPIAFTTFLFLVGVIEGAIVTGIGPSVLSTIEVRYGLTSIMTGLLSSIFDVFVVLSVLPITYLSEKSHKPRWLGIGAALQGVGAILYALPQFVGGPYIAEAQAGSTDFCASSLDFSKNCTAGSSLWVFAIFIVAVALIAIGAAPLFTVGIAFIDDIVWPKKVSVYLGVFQSCYVVGPAVGYLIGAPFLRIYVDPWIKTPLTKGDPSFVGAWWIGFVIMGIIMLLACIPLLMYPREIPESDQIRKEREKRMTMTQISARKSQSFMTRVKQFPSELARILSSPTWLLVSLTLGLTDIVVAGFGSFGPKYVEEQFLVSSDIASYGVGGVAVVCGGLGILTGGLLVYCVKGSGKKAALAGFIITFISTVATVGLFLNCPSTDVIGVPYNTSFGYLLQQPFIGASDYSPQCLADCQCTSSLYQPVCHRETETTYFSPCHAGCSGSSAMDGDIYVNCACINASFSTGATVNSFDAITLNSSVTANVTFSPAATGTVERGRCTKCFSFVPILFLLGAVLFTAFTALVPITIVTVRSVGEEQRCTALGLQSILFRIVGGIPGPLMFGAIFDNTCTLWQYECGARGNCWEYNHDQLTIGLAVCTFCVCAVRTLTMFLSWVYYGRNYCCTKVSKGTASVKPDGCSSHKNPPNNSQSVFPLDDAAENSIYI